jgi:hypothetical protein
MSSGPTIPHGKATAGDFSRTISLASADLDDEECDVDARYIARAHTACIPTAPDHHEAKSSSAAKRRKEARVHVLFPSNAAEACLETTCGVLRR